jgi:hypothetical protein
MKPIASTTPNSTHRDAFDRVMPYDRPAPITDYNYHSITFEGPSARYVRNPPRSFWKIAGDYFKMKLAAISEVKPRFLLCLPSRHLFP